MAYAPAAASSQSAKKPSAGGTAASVSSQRGSSVGKAGMSPTTHTAMDGEGRTYLNQLKTWENESKFGPYLKVRVVETVAAGTTFRLAARKDVASSFIQEGKGYNVKLNKEYVNSLKLHAEAGKFGPVLVGTLDADLQPGDYYVTVRKGKDSE